MQLLRDNLTVSIIFDRKISSVQFIIAITFAVTEFWTVDVNQTRRIVAQPNCVFSFLQLWTSENQGDEGDAGEGEN